MVDWIEGETIPQGPEVLSIAGLFGIKVYQTLDLPEPDEELVKIYKSFSHLTGEYQSRLARAIFETEKILQEKKLASNSLEAKRIILDVVNKWGIPIF